MRRIAVIGLGLIGGSIALSLKSRKPDEYRITGFDVRSEHSDRALSSGAVDAVADTAEEAVDGVDCVVLAVPVDRIRQILKQLAGSIGPHQVVTDVCSIKVPVVEAAREILPHPENFVGGHPMAGSEKGGFAAASPLLLEARPYILTPVEETRPGALGLVRKMAADTGASVAAVSPQEHDVMVAYSSHLPHVISWTLVNLARNHELFENAARFAGASFRDATRVSMSPVDLWLGIIDTNRENLLTAINEYIGELERFRQNLEDGNLDELKSYLESCRSFREKLFRPAMEEKAPVYRLEVVIPNRPGQLAAVTTLLGRSGINIENIEMVHGEGQGLLFIDVSGEEAMKKALKVLRDSGYQVSVENRREILD